MARHDEIIDPLLAQFVVPESVGKMKPQTAPNWPRQEAEISAMTRHNVLWFCSVNPVQVLHRFIKNRSKDNINSFLIL